MLEPSEGEGLEDGGGRTPTRDTTDLRPLAPPPSSCPWQPWAALLFSALEAEPPCGDAGQRAHGGTRIPGQRAFARVPAREHLCTAILDSLPQSLPPRGDGGKAEGTRGTGVQPQPRRCAGAELAHGEIRKDARKNYNAQRLATLTSAGLGASLPDTHPRALTPRKQPRQPAPAAALVAQAPRAGGRAAIRGAQAAAGQPPRGRRAGKEAGRWSWVLT